VLGNVKDLTTVSSKKKALGCHYHILDASNKSRFTGTISDRQQI